MAELKPCPFCGNVKPLVVMDDETEELFGVCCFKCEAAIKAMFDKREEAVKAWNRRTNEKLSVPKKRASASQKPFADYKWGDCQGEEGGPRQVICEMGEG